MKTRTELINAALERLGAIERGAVPSAEDAALMDGIIDPMIADLQSRNIAWNIPTTSIPYEMYLHLVAILANHAKTDFGLDGGEYDRIKLEAQEAERNLFTVVRTVQRKPKKMEFERALGPFPRARVGVEIADT